MIEQLRRRFAAIAESYTDPVQRQRARGLLVFNSAFLMLWALWVTTAIILTILGNNFFDNAGVVIAFTSTPILAVVVYRLLSAGRVRLATWLFVGFLFLATFFPTLQRVDTPTVVLLFIPLVAAGLMLEGRSLIIVLFAVMGVAVIGMFSQSQLTEATLVTPADNAALNLMTVGTVLVAVFGLLYIFGGSIQIALNQLLNDIRQFQLISRFSVRVPHTNEYTIYAGMIDLLRNEIGYTFAQIYLVDGDGSITRSLRSSPGLADPYTISTVNLGNVGAINEAIHSRQIVTITVNDSKLRRAHFLPTSIFGAAVPIINNERVLAILDVQDSRHAFSDMRLRMLSTLAEQVAALIQDVQTMNALRASLIQQEDAANNLRVQLREYKQIERQVVGSAWDTYLRRRGEQAFGFNFDIASQTVIPANDLPEKFYAALQTREILVEDHDEHRTVTVPIILRDEILGAMSFNVPAGSAITDRQMEMAQSVANRLGLALENKRLFEQSQSQALRERKANEIAGLLIGATDLDSVLTLAADSFNEALGAIHTRIHLQPEALTSALPEEKQSQNGDHPL